MRPCERCLENNWRYEKIDGWIRATCRMCDYVVEWELKPEPKYTRCRKCHTKTIKRMPEKRNPNKAFWYEYYYWCPRCHTQYMPEEAKIPNIHKNIH